ncbi:Structural maintenance of chromosomes 6 [Lecanosticta acicola]|uniref:Structural maintenance of chromosomes 6 n=1 Tax=Lecanosticta acicola TaxID=111012 RepID=A0AAI9EBU5_9PEZI|nr:Structural maintenance of chromosomes 6 [Lecanosticta acicola]
MARKRTRPTEDVDGAEEEEEIEIESASSSFRQSNKSVKRNRTALAREVGQKDFYDDLLESPNDTDVEDEPNSPSPPRIDADLEHSLHNADSEMEEEEDEIDEMAFTQHIGKKFKEKRDNIAMDEGIIEEVTCRNFMCHTKLRITLGPNINFIIGHNGSGKSAVLTALTMCLGGRAAATNRGSKLSSMIKEGTDSAMLGVKIKNRGENAYKWELYGHSITVERHFTKNGGSGFKLKNADGKTISTKKGDLDDILDYFGLQMDNPINVLSQDNARQFLANSTAADKYKFFLRGTQLEALDNDYKIFEENLDGIKDKLSLRHDDVTVLKHKFEEAEKKKKQADNIEQVRTRMRQASNQSAWAQVEEQESILEGMRRNLVDAEKKLEEAEEDVQVIDGEYDGLEAAKEAAERVLEERDNELQPAQEKHRVEKERFDANKQQLMNLKAEQRNMNQEFQKARQEVDRLDGEIQAEQTRLSEADGAQHLRRTEDLKRLQEDAKQHQQAEKDHAACLPDLQQNVANATSQVKNAKTAYERAEEVSRTAKQRMMELEGDQRNRFAAYDPKTEQLLREINKDTRWERKPVGPMGMYVHLQKPEWSSILEKTLGGNLNAFIVVHKDDQVRLSGIARRVGCNPQILVNNSAALPALNEPEEGVDTILRVLKIDDEEVRKSLIIQNAIEQTVLIRNNNEASNYFQKNNANVKAVLSFAPRHGCGIRFDRSRMHALRSSPIEAWHGHTRMKTDLAEQKRIQQERIDRAVQDRNEASDRYRQLQSDLKKAGEAVERHKREAKKLLTQRQQAEDAVEAKQAEIDENAPEDGKLQELQRQLEDAKKDKQSARESFEDSCAASSRLDEQARPLKDALDVSQAELDEVNKRIEKAQQKVQDAEAIRHEKLLEKNAVHDALQDAKAYATRMQRKVDEQDETLHKEFIDNAKKVCDRLPVPQGETAESLERKAASYREQIENAERRQGGTREQLTVAWKQASDELRKAKLEIAEFTKLEATLKDTLRERHRRWGLFRKYISARSRINFQYLLSERNFRGRVLLDHLAKKLDIAVEPDLSRKSDSGREARTLSGGEKSFSTICLLLSIWEAMGSPIRCLDEFDVFMDSVNRQQSMTLLIGAARRSVGRQFILISPQAMGGVEVNEDVKVHKMGDPERGQTNLNFNGQEL